MKIIKLMMISFLMAMAGTVFSTEGDRPHSDEETQWEKRGQTPGRAWAG